MLTFNMDSEWKWSSSKLPVKRATVGRSQDESIYQFMNLEESAQNPKEESLKINIEKVFPFEPKTGFVWHKSWNLPEITVELNEHELKALGKEYSKIGCEIMAVYPVKCGNLYYLKQVFMKGSVTELFTEAPSVSFKFLKFGETSFNNNRNKFSLLLWIYGENIYKEKDDVFCMISSPIYVDSRKEARKKDLNLSNSVKYLECPKKFNTPVGGMRGAVMNSTSGFIAYYRAQNIRNKIKHPFYIAYHFNNVFKMYLNRSQNIVNLVQVLKRIEETSEKLEGESLLLMIVNQQNESLRSNILGITLKWKFNFIEYGHPENPITEKWKPISKEEIKNSYKMYYEQQMLKDDDNELSNNHIPEQVNRAPQKQDEPRNDLEVSSKNFELRTVIDISNPRKMMKLEEQKRHNSTSQV